jgi:hypothetical protein
MEFYTPIRKVICRDINGNFTKEIVEGQDVVIWNVEIINDKTSPLHGRAVYVFAARYGEGTFHLLVEDFDRIFRKKVYNRDIG